MSQDDAPLATRLGMARASGGRALVSAACAARTCAAPTSGRASATAAGFAQAVVHLLCNRLLLTFRNTFQIVPNRFYIRCSTSGVAAGPCFEVRRCQHLRPQSGTMQLVKKHASMLLQQRQLGFARRSTRGGLCCGGFLRADTGSGTCLEEPAAESRQTPAQQPTAGVAAPAAACHRVTDRPADRGCFLPAVSPALARMSQQPDNGG